MRAKDLYISEAELINEINMSPSNLKKLVRSIDARAGMEFEMIVPNVQAEEQEPNYEPDYDQDTRTRSFSDIVEFFYDGDYNSRRDLVRLEEALQEQFEEWREEKIFENWQDDGIDYLRDYIENNDIFDFEDANEEATNELQAEYGDSLSPEDFEKMQQALVQEKFDEFVQDQWDNERRSWRDALDQFRDEQSEDFDEGDWLEQNYPYMTDIANNFDIAWPYYIDTNENEGGEFNISEVAEEFGDAIGRPVYSSTSYHGARRAPGAYSVEPDGSLDTESSEDGGIEFISPPLPIGEMLEDLDKVVAWAKDRGAYTGKQYNTGLHINVSVPGIGENSLKSIDYVKLALLLGDEYVLEQFGRIANQYCKSAMKIIRERVTQRPEDAASLLNQMKGYLDSAASKAIHTGVTNKYTSINTKDGYVEFRSPGGDWLNEYQKGDKIQNTLLRFVVALDASTDPNKYREEYLKKLYKILEPKSSKDTIAYFAQYVAGEIPKAALRSFIKQAQLERKIAKDPTGGQQYWWNVEWSNGRRMEVVATGADVAKQVAAEEWGLRPDDPQVRTFKATPIKPYSDAPVRASVGEPQAIGQRSGPTVGGRPSNPEGAWILAPRGENPPVPLFRFNAAGVDDTNNVANQWSREHPGIDVVVHHDPQQRYGQPPVPGSTLDLQRQRAAQSTASSNDLFRGFDTTRGDLTPRGPGPWEIYRISNGETVRELSNTDRGAAESEARFALGARAEAPELYGVRTRQRATQAPGENGQEYRIVNMRDRSQLTGFRAANQAAAEQEAERILRDLNLDPDHYDVVPLRAPEQQPAPQPLGAGRELVGWDIMLGGQPVHRFTGAGNNQGDANRIAQQWILQQGSNFLRQHQGEEVQVVPAWREA